jgi:hypothetical protein
MGRRAGSRSSDGPAQEIPADSHRLHDQSRLSTRGCRTLRLRPFRNPAKQAGYCRDHAAIMDQVPCRRILLARTTRRETAAQRSLDRARRCSIVSTLHNCWSATVCDAVRNGPAAPGRRRTRLPDPVLLPYPGTRAPLPSPPDRNHRRRSLARRHAGHVTIATCARDHVNGPYRVARAIWRIVGNGGHRLTLADLPADHGDPSPLKPGPPTGLGQDPRRATVTERDTWPG